MLKRKAMKSIFAGLFIISSLLVMSGCQQESGAIGNDGRPHAPSGQSIPGGPLGKGPVGQPQS